MLDTKEIPTAQNDNTTRKDADEVIFSSEKKITLSCGKSSITLYPNGKIVLKGDYILSDAEGVNRLSGGRIDIN
ncbi:hypothetical protein [Rahnella woolbedingensis]|uniref:DUF2345 domain-containing protein n=1 Tax=Rahnella woolbedingensis TaxID=1510574 RepID=A0A419N7Q5_9GAMM|nr:hypothetical protein [Rahnella woolbedingensis]RJT43515.1 hypothetical protein D6C13_13070 [Rahnella woolbedingensis]